MRAEAVALMVLLGLPSGALAVDAVRIGVVRAPGATGDAFLKGARTAAAEVNREGGIAGRPLEIEPVAATRPWLGAAPRIAELAFEREVVALLGAADGATAHLAAQIATRRRIPLLTLSGAPDLTRSGVPWIFRGLPDDESEARRMLLVASRDRPVRRAMLVVPSGREGVRQRAALEKACREEGVRVVAELADADVLLLWLDGAAARAYLRQLAGGTWRGRILGSHRLAEPEFLEAEERRGWEIAWAGAARPPESSLSAAVAHDLVRALAAAARRNGPRPEAIREGLANLPWTDGRSGVFRFDARGERLGALPLVGSTELRSPTGTNGATIAGG